MDARLAHPKHVLANVQALRAIAALLVVLVHAGLPNVGIESILGAADRPWLSPFRYIGLFGVDLFFVISGFIMLVTSWEKFGKPLAGARFLVRRIIRIYPPYWFALIPVVPVLLFAGRRFMGSHSGLQTGFLESFLLLPNPHKFVLTVGWTLVWEMIFYVVFAGLLRVNRRYVASALAVWFAVEIALYIGLKNSPNFYLNFAAAPLPMEFIFGAGVGLLYINGVFPAPRLAAAIAGLVAAGTALAVCSGSILLENLDIERIIMFGVPAMLLVYGGVGLEACGVFIAPRVLQAIGDGSYAIYLWHLSILVVVHQTLAGLHLAGPWAHAAIIAVTLALIVAFGMGVYRFFERPVTAYLNGMLAQPSRRIGEPRIVRRTVSGPAAD